MSALPAPTAAEQGVQANAYLIGPFDKLNITVFGLPDLSGEWQVDASGQLSVPLAGTLVANGKTPAALATEISNGLRDRYVRSPQVTVNLREAGNRVVTVDGQVTEPGLYPVVGRMTLVRAVAAAKGLNEFAREENVVIFRSVQGQRLAGVYNLRSIREGRYDDPEIYANDVVVVGASSSRRLFRDLLALAPAILTPLVYILR